MYAEQACTAVRLGSVSRRYHRPIGPRAGCLGGVEPVSSSRSVRMLLSGEASAEMPRGDGPAARSARLAQLEAVLFLSQQPQNSRKLAELAGLPDGTRARTLVRALNKLYDVQGSAFRVEEVAGGFQLMTRPDFAPWLRRLHNTSVEVRLSAPAMETLAVVAYRQPILRAEVEAIRGVQCGEILRQLIERNLVRIAGRSEELGRPFLYGTTRQFLEVFGLRNLDELPRAEQFRPSDDSLRAKTGDNVKADRNEADKEMMNQANDSSESVEEANVNCTVLEDRPLEELAEKMPSGSPLPQAAEVPDEELQDDELPLDDEQEEEDEELEDDEDFDDDFDEDFDDEDEYEYEDVDEDEEEDDDYEYVYEDDDEDGEEDDEEDGEYEDEDDLEDDDVWEEVEDDEDEYDDEEEWEDDDEEDEDEDEDEDDDEDEDSWYDEDEED